MECISTDMIPTDVWNKMNNLEAFEKHMETTLTIMRKNYLSQSWMTRARRDQVSKNSEKSENFRQFGNRQYLKCDGLYYINSAIESFTKSIAYAPLGSTELSLAYANRSALLMKAKLYDDALVDIRRALKAGYPDRLKAKLFLRRALCLKAVNPTAESDIEKALENARGWLRRMDKKSLSRQIVTDTLNHLDNMAVLPPPRTKWNAKRFLNGVFEENSEIIDASSSIVFKPTENDEVGIIATKDIKPGEIIFAQEPYVVLLHADRLYTHCWHCHDQTLSAIPCNSCSQVIFCSETCRDAAWSEYHGIECHVLSMDVLIETPYIPGGVRMMIRTVQEAGSIHGLKEIIQRIESDPDLTRKGFTGGKFDGNDLSRIYGLPTYDVTQISGGYKSLTFVGLTAALLLATRSNFFGEKMSVKKFYRHKSVPFVAAMLMRFFLISLRNLEHGYDAMDSSTTMNPSLMIVPLHSYIAHSRAPNVSRCIIGSKVVIYAHYPIKRSEQIFLYKGAPLTENSERNLSVYRQSDIIQPFGCSSWCVACTENLPDTHLPQCHVFLAAEDLLLAHKALLERIDEQLKLSKHAHFAVIAKFINDLSVIISDWWNSELRCSRELAQAVTLLNRIFFMLGILEKLLTTSTIVKSRRFAGQFQLLQALDITDVLSI